MTYYFSGTGNSRFVAQEIARLTDDITCPMDHSSMPAVSGSNEALLGIVFPVYGWRLPRIVEEFCKHLDETCTRGRFVYVVMTCGTDAGKAFDILRSLLASRNITVNSAYTVIMPDVYVCLPGFDVDNNKLRKKKFRDIPERIAAIAADINARRPNTDIFEGALPRTKTYVIGSLFFRFLLNDRPFNVNSSCDGCGICKKSCPVNNIAIVNGHPSWLGHCEGCLNCYHSCPHHAINFWKQTRHKGQYTFRRYSREMKEILAAAEKKAQQPMPQDKTQQ